jgi:hypothetical protein
VKLIDKTVKVPARSLQGERDTEGNRTNTVRAHFGRAALEVGTTDHGLNGGDTDGCRTDAVDTIANVLHWLHHRGIDPQPVLESASCHFRAEIQALSLEQQAVGILKDADIDAYLHHTGGGVWVAEVTSSTIPGRTAWVTDSEGAQGGPFLVGAYPDAEGQGWFESLSGPCSADDLPAQVRRALTQPAG